MKTWIAASGQDYPGYSVFNSARYIEQAIQSVISQHYPNLEYFIIDGGSTDGSVEIIRNMSALERLDE